MHLLGIAKTLEFIRKFDGQESKEKLPQQILKETVTQN
jgi:hypothetical protein